MTINVSIRVPDGVVIGADSLATSLVPLKAQVQLGSIRCEKCKHEMQGGAVQMPPIGVPGSSTPLASKLFYVGNYGVTFFGTSSLNGRSLFNHVMMFRTSSYKEGMTLEEIADGLSRQLQDAALGDPAVGKAKPGTTVVGFQICGYDEGDVDVGQTSVVTLNAGRQPKREKQAGYGVTVTGQDSVVRMLFSNTQGATASQPSFAKMTLPDAIDYARFLVQTTSDYHRFADTVPLVGGPTEIALITKWIGFRWIERKRILGDDTTRLNIGKITHEIGQMRRELPDIIRKSREADLHAQAEGNKTDEAKLAPGA
jgi:hypothetical protein